MAYYRLYFLDQFSGHIDHFSDFQAETDDAAIAYAEEALGVRPLELWCQRPKVKRWDGLRVSPRHQTIAETACTAVHDDSQWTLRIDWIASVHACSQRRQDSAQMRQCLCSEAWPSHSSAQRPQVMPQASRTVTRARSSLPVGRVAIAPAALQMSAQSS